MLFSDWPITPKLSGPGAEMLARIVDCFCINTIELFRNLDVTMWMDERRTLQILAWGIGGLVGVLFILNAVALSAAPG
jgi:hypothetical protein